MVGGKAKDGGGRVTRGGVVRLRPRPFCFQGICEFQHLKRLRFFTRDSLVSAELLTRRTHTQESKAFRADRKWYERQRGGTVIH